MFTKIKNIYKSSFVQQFRDSRVVVLVGFGVLALFIAWGAAKAIQTNYELQKQIADLNGQTELQKLENQNLELRNQYLKTDRFLELAARRQFGKAVPGETVLNVPTAVALSHVEDIPAQTDNSKKPESLAKKPTYQRNFQQWINFFFHRGSAAE